MNNWLTIKIALHKLITWINIRRQFFHGKFYDWRESDEYKKGVRTILSIKHETPARIISDDFLWTCRIKYFKIIIGWVLFNFWIPYGKVEKSGMQRNNDENCCC